MMNTIEQHILAATHSGYLIVDRALRVVGGGGAPDVAAMIPAPQGRDLTELFPELIGSEDQLAALLAGTLDRLLIPHVNRVGPDGAVRYVDLLTLPRTNAADQVDGLIQVVTDVSAQGVREQASVQQRNELRLLKEQATRQNLALARMNADLLRATRLKDEFLAGMSHEVRTPLTAIIGLNDLLRAQMIGPLSDEQIRMLDQIDAAGRHLLAMINDFLEIARIEAGRLELSPTVVSVRSLCETSLRMVKELALRKRISINLQIAPNVLAMRADERRLSQALINLLSNAVKFTPPDGAIGLDVQGDAEAGQLRFTVWDTGIGIAATDMLRLFQPFVQINNVFQREHQGSGLGLVLMSQLVELHGGGVSLSSEVGKGSQFTIAIPWSPDEQQAMLAQLGEHVADERKLRRDDLGTITLPERARHAPVLLVEDDQAGASMLIDFLERCGYQVVHVGSGEEALAYVREELPCLILTDMRLHGMQGIELIRELRKLLPLQKTPVVALTALAMPGDRERCLAAGADIYLSKPVRLLRLAQAMSDLLG